MKRVLEPELLDGMAPDDPAAISSRRDLVRINWVMGQQRILAGALRKFPAPRRVLDLGGGDGRFLLSLARRLGWQGVTALILDRQNIVEDATRSGFAALGWRCDVRQADVLAGLGDLDRGDILVANLFLHHLDEAALQKLFAAATRAGGMVACEPRRNAWALAASRMVFALGCNAVTRHDAVASVRAGFRSHELSALWPEESGWRCQEPYAAPFSHLFTARHGV